MSTILGKRPRPADLDTEPDWYESLMRELRPSCIRDPDLWEEQFYQLLANQHPPARPPRLSSSTPPSPVQISPHPASPELGTFWIRVDGHSDLYYLEYDTRSLASMRRLVEGDGQPRRAVWRLARDTGLDLEYRCPAPRCPEVLIRLDPECQITLRWPQLEQTCRDCLAALP